MVVVVASVKREELREARRVEPHELAVEHATVHAVVSRGRPARGDADLHRAEVDRVDLDHDRGLEEVPAPVEHRGSATPQVVPVAQLVAVHEGDAAPAEDARDDEDEDESDNRSQPFFRHRVAPFSVPSISGG